MDTGTAGPELGPARQFGRAHPRVVTGVVSLVGYALVVGVMAFPDAAPVPAMDLATVDLLSALVAIVNTVAATCLAWGWYEIRRGNVARHRRLMLSAFGLILLFLVLYLAKIAGSGGTKVFVGPAVVKTYVYLPLLGIHLMLSILAVPVVVYAVVLGLTHSVAELPSTAHPRVGRVAAASWLLSLVLGVATYLLLNVVYAYEFETSAALFLGGVL